MKPRRSVKYQIPIGSLNGVLNFTIGDAMLQNFSEFAGMAQSSVQSPSRLIEAINQYHSSEGLYVRIWRPQPAFSVRGPGPDNEMPDPPPSAMLILADPSSSASTTATNPTTRGSQVGELTITVPGYSVSGAKTLQVEIKD